jgi:starvation-inducible DNA-binding protein
MNTTMQTFATHHDLPERLRKSMLPLLNQQLADTLDLYSQVKQAHWTVKGMNFMQLHLLFDEIANTLVAQIDTIAERAMALGGIALGTTRLAADNSHLPEYPTEIVDGKQVLLVLTQRFANYVATTRAAITTASEHGDPTTADLFTEISRSVDKQLWFLEAHLQE